MQAVREECRRALDEVLAAERARLGAPLLLLAEELDAAVADPEDDSEWSTGYVEGQAHAAARIRRVLRSNQ